MPPLHLCRCRLQIETSTDTAHNTFCRTEKMEEKIRFDVEKKNANRKRGKRGCHAHETDKRCGGI